MLYIPPWGITCSRSRRVRTCAPTALPRCAAMSRSLLRHARLYSTSLPLAPPSLHTESAVFNARVDSVQAFFDQPRFAALKRPYTAANVASKQGSLPVLPLHGTLLADKLWRLFEERAAQGKPVHTMGAVDPVQMTQMAAHQEVVYISGWACSSLLTTCSNEVGPDIGSVSIIVFAFFIRLIPPQRLPVHNCAQPGTAHLSRTAVARQETLR